MSIQDLLLANVKRAITAKEQLLSDSAQMAVFVAAVEAVIERYRKGGRLLIAGNGGSAADSQHLAAEFVSKLARDRNPLPAEALTTDTSILTAIGNDYGFEHVFARQIYGKAKPDDVFLGITTSGKSPNILRAVEAAKQTGILSVVFSGRDGGPVAGLADFCIVAPGSLTSTIQEIHILLAHTLCESVEEVIFPR